MRLSDVARLPVREIVSGALSLPVSRSIWGRAFSTTSEKGNRDNARTR